MNDTDARQTAVSPATMNPLAIIAWLAFLPAWAAAVHQTLHVEARPPRPPNTIVRWRDILIAMLLGLAAAVPAVVLAGIGVLLLAFAGLAGGGPSDSTIIFCLALLELLVVAAVAGGVVFALRRFASRGAAATAGAALGIGSSAGVILYWLVDSRRSLTAALTACFVLVWLLVGRWWLNKHARPARRRPA
jgi:hypothetical protein